MHKTKTGICCMSLCQHTVHLPLKIYISIIILSHLDVLLSPCSLLISKTHLSSEFLNSTTGTLYTKCHFALIFQCDSFEPTLFVSLIGWFPKVWALKFKANLCAWAWNGTGSAEGRDRFLLFLIVLLYFFSPCTLLFRCCIITLHKFPIFLTSTAAECGCWYSGQRLIMFTINHQKSQICQGKGSVCVCMPVEIKQYVLLRWEFKDCVPRAHFSQPPSETVEPLHFLSQRCRLGNTATGGRDRQKIYKLKSWQHILCMSVNVSKHCPADHRKSWVGTGRYPCVNGLSRHERDSDSSLFL